MHLGIGYVAVFFRSSSAAIEHHTGGGSQYVMMRSDSTNWELIPTRNPDAYGINPSVGLLTLTETRDPLTEANWGVHKEQTTALPLCTRLPPLISEQGGFGDRRAQPCADHQLMNLCFSKALVFNNTGLKSRAELDMGTAPRTVQNIHLVHARAEADQRVTCKQQWCAPREASGWLAPPLIGSQAQFR